MEILDIVDENGVSTGKTVDRDTAHRDGIRHRTSHVWVARIRGDHEINKNAGQINADEYEESDIARQLLEGVELLLQKRSPDKDSHPGCLDISSAGHIPAGSSYVVSALRELKEELGISAEASELHFCGKRRKAYQKRFHEEIFSDNQVSNVYVMFRDISAEQIVYQRSEISDVFWMPFNDVYDMVEQNLSEHCIAMDEMELLCNYLCDHMDVLTGELA